MTILSVSETEALRLRWERSNSLFERGGGGCSLVESSERCSQHGPQWGVTDGGEPPPRPRVSQAGRLPAGSWFTSITFQKMPLPGQTSSLDLLSPGIASSSGIQSSGDLQQHLMCEDSGRCRRASAVLELTSPWEEGADPLSKLLRPHTCDPHPSAWGPPADSRLHPPSSAALPAHPGFCRVLPLPVLTVTSSKRVF